jgi:hypothetical protein
MCPTVTRQEEVFVVQSKRINIGRYNSDRKHQKITKDEAKTLKNLQEYIRPFSSVQISERTKGTAWDKLQNWKWGMREGKPVRAWALIWTRHL